MTDAGWSATRRSAVLASLGVRIVPDQRSGAEARPAQWRYRGSHERGMARATKRRSPRRDQKAGSKKTTGQLQRQRTDRVGRRRVRVRTWRHPRSCRWPLLVALGVLAPAAMSTLPSRKAPSSMTTAGAWISPKTLAEACRTTFSEALIVPRTWPPTRQRATSISPSTSPVLTDHELGSRANRSFHPTIDPKGVRKLELALDGAPGVDKTIERFC